MSGHDVDIPVTNLDDPEDDLMLDNTDASDVLTLDYELDNNSLHLDKDETDETIASRLKTTVTRIFTGGKHRYKKFDRVGNDIELEERNGERNNEDYDDDDMDDQHYAQIIANALGLFDKKAKRRRIKKIIFFVICGLVALYALVLTILKIVQSLGGDNDNGRQDIKLVSKRTVSNGTHEFYPTTLMISLDGFHPHYISSDLTPFMHNMLVNEYGAPFMIPSFPSSTFPNHWTLVTGLYPSEHGVIGNTFYDPESKRQFVNTKPDLSLIEDWWGGEAIWQTAALQGISSAIHMWPGSEVPFKDPKIQPMEVDAFNKSEVLSAKVDRVLGWLDRDISARPELLLYYVPTIDTLGHKYGIGDELDDGLRQVDGMLENLYGGIADRNLTDILNLVIVSDHGMAPTANDRIIFLDDIVNLTKIEHIDGWPLFALRPYAEYDVDSVFEEMKNNYMNDPNKANYDIFLTADLPEEYHFGGKIHNEYSERLAPIWVVPKLGYSIIKKADWEAKSHQYSPKGVHGYNNTEVLMRATFIGSGPFFRSKLSEKSTKVKPFNNVEVYNIICDTLNLVPAANNGSRSYDDSNSFHSYIDSSNALPADWVDVYDYPNVSFTEETNIMREQATYDTLYRNKPDTNEDQQDQEPDVSSDEKSSTDEDNDESEANDGNPQNDQVNEDNGATDTDKPGDITKGEDENHKVNEHDDDDDDDDDKEEDEDSDDDDDDSSDEEEDTSKNIGEEDEDGKKGHHGLFDIVEDLIDDVEDAMEDLADTIEDTFDDLMHGDPGSH